MVEEAAGNPASCKRDGQVNDQVPHHQRRILHHANRIGSLDVVRQQAEGGDIKHRPGERRQGKAVHTEQDNV
jgi:hypothetical protein